MTKAVINVGNSKAVIIPKKLIDKYSLERVSLKEIEGGILIVPEESRVSFAEKVESLRKEKKAVYSRMKIQANDPKTLQYYEKELIGDIDSDIED